MTPKDMLRLIGDDNEGQDASKRVEKMAEVELRASADGDNTRRVAVEKLDRLQ